VSAAADELIARLTAVERRLADHVAAEDRGLPAGLSDPDPGEAERWEAGQLWAHVAEFPSYWLGQIRSILDAHAAGERGPVPFGRLKTDPDRLAAIERDRHTDPGALLARCRADLRTVVDTIRGLPAEAWSVEGLHPTAGPMSVGAIIERFLASHLEEHAGTLDGLRSSTSG
jgi:DinB superfamily